MAEMLKLIGSAALSTNGFCGVSASDRKKSIHATQLINMVNVLQIWPQIPLAINCNVARVVALVFKVYSLSVTTIVKCLRSDGNLFMDMGLGYA